MAEILFESFAIQSLSLMKTPSLVLHASGRTSGVVWENGFSSSYVAPVYEGFPLKHTTICSPVTGEALTDRLYKLMTVLGYSFTTPMEKDLLDKIKVFIIVSIYLQPNEPSYLYYFSAEPRICCRRPGQNRIAKE